MSNSAVVVDCSLLADLLLVPSTVAAELDAILLWHAPSLIEFELLSVLRGLMLAGRISPRDAERAVHDIEQLGLRLWPLEGSLSHRVLQLAHNFSAYDAAYVALAEGLGVPLATRDKRMAAAADGLVEVWLL